ncbi:cbb3-type cytochrome c oxidase N-terminal domain-containing protein [Tenacibaculum sp. IB213877]|uniref:cbb3-type cytochrome c oxidase N-terminal domain-containing protein n=1 Tax=Tenacibaculum sp. IB213877 TaxID=3097351 RepID=UPI002A5A0288|nr:cbb3-type cytochrome c oxidase N-terminal domain-containing protein [Tenacibaculum sp. IB213877]MDY0781407.1 cbb3-type cytochrome c oxidase N-terminal domain-containing protein [Tenacibaculum sp. IB213877]
MKKYIQSIAYIAFIGITSWAIITAIRSYENPFSLYEHPLVWIALVALILVVALKEWLNVTALKKTEELTMEKLGISLEEVDNWAWAKKLINKWTKARAIEEEADIELDHNYDGIKELDNSLPPWWLYLFYITMVFAVVYLVRYHIYGADNQALEYEKEVAQAKIELAKYKAATPDAFDINNVTLLTEESDLARGKAVFNLNCVACHAADGGGGIGPNLTDEFWILGGGFKNAFHTIYNGGRDGKGMVAWNKTLKPIDIQKVASYVMSLQGTTPAAPKAPQGDKWVEEGAAPEATPEQPAEENETQATTQTEE